MDKSPKYISTKYKMSLKNLKMIMEEVEDEQEA